MDHLEAIGAKSTVQCNKYTTEKMGCGCGKMKIFKIPPPKNDAEKNKMLEELAAWRS